jgi:hypothetical protein
MIKKLDALNQLDGQTNVFTFNWNPSFEVKIGALASMFCNADKAVQTLLKIA